MDAQAPLQKIESLIRLLGLRVTWQQRQQLLQFLQEQGLLHYSAGRFLWRSDGRTPDWPELMEAAGINAPACDL